MIKFFKKIFAPTWHSVIDLTSEPKVVDIGWQLVPTVGYAFIPIEKIFARIWVGDKIRPVDIEETPHYGFIKSLIEGNEYGFKKYKEYYKRYLPQENIDRQIEKIKDTVKYFNYHGINASSIVVHQPVMPADLSDFYVELYDGNHRLALAKILGYEKLKCWVKSKAD